ncbi:MAG: hypothetical protein HYZ46_04885 [Nitrosomonadales bacterium]|nr:hypothetical protein [Nitrosomonadales bacterium]
MQSNETPIAGRSCSKSWLEMAVVFAALLVFFWRPIDDYDIWFYMVQGREVAATGKIPDTIFYLLPLLDQPATYIEWGFGLIYHWAYALGGYAGMAALNATLRAAMLALAYGAAMGKRERLHPVALSVLALVAWWMTSRINYRAETALLLAMAATLWALEKYAVQGGRRWLLIIPLSGWLLIQLHPSVALLLPLLGAYAVELCFAPPHGSTRSQVVLTLVAVALVTLALACINPYGWQQVAVPFNYLSSAQELMAGITEFLPVMETEYADVYVFMVVCAVLAMFVQRERRISGSLLVILFGTLTFLYVRNIGLFALLLLGPLVRSALRFSPVVISSRMRYAGAFVVLAALLALPVWQKQLGSGPMPGAFPEKSAAYLEQRLPGGNVLNFYDYGGFLAWALGSKFMIFVDGHDTGTNRAVELHDAIFRADAGWENIVAQYRIDAIFTPTVMQFSGRVIPLVGQLSNNSQWRLVVRENSGLLFLRADLAGEEGLDKRQIWEQMLEQAQHELDTYPDHADAWAAIATAHQALGNDAKAEEARQQYLRLSKQAQ